MLVEHGPCCCSFRVGGGRLVGAEYTPWRAVNQLWWHNYTHFRPDVVREVAAMEHQVEAAVTCGAHTARRIEQQSEPSLHC